MSKRPSCKSCPHYVWSVVPASWPMPSWHCRSGFRPLINDWYNCQEAAQDNVLYGQELFLRDPDFRMLSLQSQALISQLGLVLGPMPKDWIVWCKTPLFCDVVKAFRDRKSADRARLCRDIYLRNRSRSRYVYRSYID